MSDSTHWAQECVILALVFFCTFYSFTFVIRKHFDFCADFCHSENIIKKKIYAWAAAAAAAPCTDVVHFFLYVNDHIKVIGTRSLIFFPLLTFSVLFLFFLIRFTIQFLDFYLNRIYISLPLYSLTRLFFFRVFCSFKNNHNWVTCVFLEHWSHSFSLAHSVNQKNGENKRNNNKNETNWTKKKNWEKQMKRTKKIRKQ